jgi:short-subunit dehydrogenase
MIADRERAPIILDLSRSGNAARMVEETIDRLCGLDGLLNNAGATRT